MRQRSGRRPATGPWRWCLLAVAVLAVSSAQCFLLPRKPVEKIILLSIDTLRADRLGCYGFTALPTSPSIDAWAKDALLFERAYSQAPWTVPSMSSLNTGRYPVEIGAYTNMGDIGAGSTTLVERLAKAGYRTAFFNTNPVLLRKGFRAGFESVVPQGFQKKIPYTTVEPQVMEWLDVHAKEKFFLWVHNMDPHSPPTEGNPYLQTKGWQRYPGEVRWVDEAFARLLAKIEALGIREQVLFIFTADHGEAFGEHGLSGHQDVIYDEALHVPLMIRYPGKQRTGRSDALVSLLDVHATIADLAGLPPADAARGESLVPILMGRATQLNRRHVFSSRYYFLTDRTDKKTGKVLYRRGEHHLVVRDDRWKLIAKVMGAGPKTMQRPEWKLDAEDSNFELYDTTGDPKETTDVVAANERVKAELQAQLGEWQRLSQAAPTVVPPKLEPGAREIMRALGYATD